MYDMNECGVNREGEIKSLQAVSLHVKGGTAERRISVIPFLAAV